MFLFAVILIIYIGLGIPDSAFGTALPVMWPNLGFDYSLASIITVVIYIGTLLSSYLSPRLERFFGAYLTISLSTLLTAVGLMGFSVSSTFITFVIFSLIMGFGAGAIDATINNFVSLNYSSSFMNFMHCFYGIGVALTPFIFSLVFSRGNDWRLGYRIVALIQFGLALVAFLSFPLWKKSEKESKTETVILPYRVMAKTKGIKSVWAIFFLTCALEFTCDTWGASYLVYKGLTSQTAATLITFYYVGITLGRFLSGIYSKRHDIINLFNFGYILIAVAIVLIILPISPTVKGISLFLIGVGNGPVFPNLTYLSPRVFGKEISSSLISSQMCMSCLGILIAPPVFGVVSKWLTFNFFPYFIAVIFLVQLLSTISFQKVAKSL